MPASAPPSNDVTLTIDGKIFGGWQDVIITRGIEIMPSAFNLRLTERYPGQASQVVILPEQAVTVKIGNDVVITGYIDRYEPAISARGHEVRVMGRGKCLLLVDGSAGVLPGAKLNMQVNQTTAIDLAVTLTKPFGITVTKLNDENDLPFGSFIINAGETVFEIIDRISRYRALIPYEGTDGNLILSAVGKTQMASGFVQGQNVEQARASFGMDQRFSDYVVLWTALDTTGQIAQATGAASGNQHGYVKDSTVSLFRPHVIVSEQVSPLGDVGQQRAAWEMNRRNGRSQVVNVTCDSWRDGAGKLWQPNALALVDIPICKVVKQTWIIAEVTFRRGRDGTHADLTLMPPAAFEPQPQGLSGSLAQIYLSLNPRASNKNYINPIPTAASQAASRGAGDLSGGSSIG